jgi:1-acyl-sn-glycerol-3-phosphate acyltransferase
VAVVRSILFALAFYIGSIPFVIHAFIASLISANYLRKAVWLWSSYHHFIARWVLGIRTQVVGKMADKPVIYAVKHESMFETIDMPRMFGWPAVIAKKELFRIPLWGRAGKTYGMMAVDRDAGSSALRAMVIWGKAMRAAGRPIVIFPEGTRVPHGETRPLQSGFAGLYKLIGLPVVPVAVNSGILCPRDQKIRYSGTITYLIGEEIPAGLPREEIEARVIAAINALNN